MATNTKSAWFDEASSTSAITDHAKRLDSFLQAIADGKVTDEEVKAQEERVVKLMKEVEPQLDPKLREQVTQLLCEVTAYDMMQSLNMMQSARPVTKFRG
jgi:3-methyladenine DNA glycosylase Tag